MSKHKKITLVKEAIHNPDEPRHYMTVVKSSHSWSANIGASQLAEDSAAIELREVGHNIYDPVIYFTRACVNWTFLKESTKSTSCPLKGTTDYFDFVDGENLVEDVAWTYRDTITAAISIKGLIAFDSKKVTIKRSNRVISREKK